jgi:hypothetical protein
MNDIETRIRQAQARLNDLKAAARKQERRNETRRKIIYGAAVLSILEDFSGERAAEIRRKLHAKVSRPSDREFLKLKMPSEADGE